MKLHALCIMTPAVILIAGCAHDPASPFSPSACPVLSAPKAPSEQAIKDANCPNSTEVYLSAIFDDQGHPTGVGGGTVAGNGNKNDKKVEAGQNICWLATDESGNFRSDIRFSILFSPSDNPGQNATSVESVNVHPQLPSGLEYKYTVWADSDPCGFLDPKFVVK